MLLKEKMQTLAANINVGDALKTIDQPERTYYLVTEKGEDYFGVVLVIKAVGHIKIMNNTLTFVPFDNIANYKKMTN